MLTDCSLLNFEILDSKKSLLKLVSWANLQSLLNITRRKEEENTLVLTWKDSQKKVRHFLMFFPFSSRFSKKLKISHKISQKTFKKGWRFANPQHRELSEIPQRADQKHEDLRCQSQQEYHQATRPDDRGCDNQGI